MFTSITGRSVVVTGGTRGIGKGIAQVFARAGGNVLITDGTKPRLRQQSANLLHSIKVESLVIS